jgi:hypothetical protein
MGLKEWHSVTLALSRGRQCLLLRKGGIHETEGKFTLEHDRFVLFPTWLHQRGDWIKPGDQTGIEAGNIEPDMIDISSWASVTDIVCVESRQQMDLLDALHIWQAPLIDMRFEYKPHNPLYLLIVRAWRLRAAVTIRNTPAYAGCKSWVPLDHDINLAHSVPALDDATFANARQQILAVFQSHI